MEELILAEQFPISKDSLNQFREELANDQVYKYLCKLCLLDNLIKSKKHKHTSLAMMNY